MCGAWKIYQRARDLSGNVGPMVQSLTVGFDGGEIKYRVSGYLQTHSWGAFKVEKDRAMGMADGG